MAKQANVQNIFICTDAFECLNTFHIADIVRLHSITSNKPKRLPLKFWYDSGKLLPRLSTWRTARVP